MRIIRVLGRAGATGVLLAAPVAMAGTAGAVPPERIPFEDSFSFTDDNFCDAGLTVEGTGAATGVTVIRHKADDYYTDHVKLVQTYTAHGITLRSVERTILKDLTIVDNGATLTITVLATGNFTLYGPSGKAIARNPGQVRFRIVIVEATGEELSFTQIKGSTGRSDDFCASALAAFGH